MHRSRISEGALCAVCSDRAQGCYYGVIACNSCKAYFRRVCQDPSFIERYACRNGGNCSLTKRDRLDCKRCRYDKCINVGMNPNAVSVSINRLPSAAPASATSMAIAGDFFAAIAAAANFLPLQVQPEFPVPAIGIPHNTLNGMTPANPQKRALAVVDDEGLAKKAKVDEPDAVSGNNISVTAEAPTDPPQPKTEPITVGFADDLAEKENEQKTLTGAPEVIASPTAPSIVLPSLRKDVGVLLQPKNKPVHCDVPRFSAEDNTEKLRNTNQMLLTFLAQRNLNAEVTERLMNSAHFNEILRSVVKDHGVEANFFEFFVGSGSLSAS